LYVHGGATHIIINTEVVSVYHRWNVYGRLHKIGKFIAKTLSDSNLLLSLAKNWFA